MTDRPRIILPKVNTESGNKFVQLYIEGEPYFRWSFMEGHATILGNALEEFGLEFDLMRNRNRDLIPKHWKAGEYTAVGMGYIKFGERFYELYKKSIDYELKSNQKHAGDMLIYLPKGKEFVIR